MSHWGTKDSSRRYGDDGATFRFETAWDPPTAVIEELSRRFPKVTFTVEFADEDLGHYVGRYAIQNGTVLPRDRIKDGSHEDRHFAQALWGLGKKGKL